MSTPPLLDVSGFDRSPTLTTAEREALAFLGSHLRRGRYHDPELPHWGVVDRLLIPLDAARLSLHQPDTVFHRRSLLDAVGLVLSRCAEEGSAYWGWPEDTWVRLIGEDEHAFKRPCPGWLHATVRLHVAAYGYLLCGFAAFHRLGSFKRLSLAERIFGREAIADALGAIRSRLDSWGYHQADPDKRLRGMLVHALLVNRSARLEDLTTEALECLGSDPRMGWRLSTFHSIRRAIAAMGFADPPTRRNQSQLMAVQGAPADWMMWVERWCRTSTLAPAARSTRRNILAMAGRWLTAEQPAIISPADWTRETCAAWVALVTRARIGDYAQRRTGLADRVGRRFAPSSISGYIAAIRTFFRDCQEWGWCARRFDPLAALATPRSILAMLGPKPRVIADDAWAKILWAGLNLDADDLGAAATQVYPFEFIRALTLTWLFAAQRSDEIARLRVGCIRWQPSDDAFGEPVCLLDVPVHKTGTAFTKPVDPLMGRAIEAWERVRPEQPSMADRKTGEHVDLLFACRARPVANTYINGSVIPMLCRKAGVSPSDVRGRITSHRARATIASQLYNAKEPMTLFELQAWLGHRSPETTQYYAQITPNTLTKAYTDAGYFARNVRTIEVLIDRKAVLDGTAAAGEPWQYYDLGHGYCGYTFFEQCPHRMACARCDFYSPKPSAKAQLLEAKSDIDRRLALIPLTDTERAAVEQDQQAVGKLLDGLADTPTPAGPTPRELATRQGGMPARRPATNGGDVLVKQPGDGSGRAGSRRRPSPR